jgi:nitroimidazol reductase NimA-like FMN-containing flavoprotein (pyridoxamine 5'-phosphate oxidase superfamily)
LNSGLFEPRHKEKMIEDRRQIDEILENAQVGRLAVSMDNRPYVVPMNFVYYQGKVYFHCAHEGQMISYLKANSQVCFEVDESEPIPNVDPCEFTFKYRSVIADGRVRFIESVQEKRAVLALFVQKYDKGKIAVYPIPEGKLADVAVGEIAVEKVTGRKNQPS